VGDIRKCIVELIEVTAIDRNAKTVLFSGIMSHGAEFIRQRLYTKHLLQKLARRIGTKPLAEKQRDGGNRS